jgi:uncharacterized protein (DUF1697 family)
MADTEVFVALLRGINVGGNNRLPMADLVEICSEARCQNVRTYIQSGNVILQAAKSRAQTLGAELARAIERSAGLKVPVVIRTAAELDRVVKANPFTGVETTQVHVVFLAHQPDATAIRALDEKRSPGDEFRVVGREVFLRLPNGVARSKLTNDYFDRTLATTSTVRNWNTVLKLRALAAGE